MPGRCSPPAALRGRWKGTDPAVTAGPTAPVSAAWARPSRPARSKVSLRPHLYGNEPLVSLRSPRDEAEAGSPLAGRGDGRQPGPAPRALGKSGCRQRRDGTAAGETGGLSRGTGTRLLLSLPLPGKFAGSSAALRSRRDQPAGAPPLRDLPRSSARSPAGRRICSAPGSAPPGSGAAAVREEGGGRSHRGRRRGRGARGCRSRRRLGRESVFPGGIGLSWRYRAQRGPSGCGAGCSPSLTPCKSRTETVGAQSDSPQCGGSYLGCNYIL